MHFSTLGISIGMLALPVWSSVEVNSRIFDHGTIGRRQAQPAPGQLNDFQVYEPVLTPEGPSDQHGCVYTTVLMEYNFANSYGSPFVGMLLHSAPPVYAQTYPSVQANIRHLRVASIG